MEIVNSWRGKCEIRALPSPLFISPKGSIFDSALLSRIICCPSFNSLGTSFNFGIGMARIRILSNLRPRQNPKSAQSTAAQIRGRSLSFDQFSGNSEESAHQIHDGDEFVAGSRGIGVSENILMEKPQHEKIGVGEVAMEVSKFIRTQPRWEQTLLTEFPSVNFADPTVYNAVLSQQSNAFLSLRFYSWLRYFNGLSFNPGLCNVVFDRLVDASAANVAKSFLDETKFEPEPQYLEGYIRCLCENGLINEALLVFERLRSIGYDVSLETWNLALNHSVRTEKSDLVWRLYGHMMECGVVADINTIGCLIRAFSLEGNAAKGYELLQQVLAAGHVPDSVVFNKLVSALCKNGSYGKVSAVLHHMIAKNRAPDIYTYQEVIDNLCKVGKGDEGFHIFKELRDRGYCPDRVMYTTVIRGLCKSNNLEDARKLWVEMIDNGMVPNEYTYNVFLDGLFKNGFVDEAEKLYEEMLTKGCGETTIIYNTIINGLCLNRKVEEARLLFNRMNDKGIARDSITYNSLLKGYFLQGNVTEGTYLLKELLERGFHPTATSFTMLIEKLCEAGHVKEAETMWMDWGLAPAAHYCSLDPIVLGLSKQGRFGEAIQWLGYMISNRIRPKNKTFEGVAESLSAAGKVGDGLFVLGYMLKMGVCTLERLSAIVR